MVQAIARNFKPQKGERPNVYRIMTDEALGAAIARLERDLDRLDNACWPAATAERERIRGALDQAREEVERRRT